MITDERAERARDNRQHLLMLLDRKDPYFLAALRAAEHLLSLELSGASQSGMRDAQRDSALSR